MDFDIKTYDFKNVEQKYQTFEAERKDFQLKIKEYLKEKFLVISDKLQDEILSLDYNSSKFEIYVRVYFKWEYDRSLSINFNLIPSRRTRKRDKYYIAWQENSPSCYLNRDVYKTFDSLGELDTFLNERIEAFKLFQEKRVRDLKPQTVQIQPVSVVETLFNSILDNILK